MNPYRVIAIPSKARKDNLKIAKFLPQLMEKYRTYLVVEPQDYDSYKEKYPSLDILRLPENDRGIGFSRWWIQKHFSLEIDATRPQGTTVLMIDDNVHGFGEKTELKTSGGHPKIVSLNDITPAIDELFKVAEEFNYAGMSHQKNIWMIHGHERGFGFGRIWKVFAFTRKLLDAGVEFDVKGMPFEDFDFTAQALRAGFFCPIISSHGFNVPVQIGATPGGIQCFDRDKLSFETSEYMLKKWGPEIVKLTRNKLSGRSEPRFSWRKLRACATHTNRV